MPPSSEMGTDSAILEARLRNPPVRREGFEYVVVNIPNKEGLKFGLGIKNVMQNIYIFKVEGNSMVTGLLHVADRIVEIDGELVHDNEQCRQLLVRGLKERKVAVCLIERGATEEAKRWAMDELNEEHNLSVVSPPDVQSILKKMEQKLFGRPPCPLTAMTHAQSPTKERKACQVEERHTSVLIQMDGSKSKLKKVEKKPPPSISGAPPPSVAGPAPPSVAGPAPQ